MDTIKFSDSWNGKLNCKCFTTFRLATTKYQIGKTYRIELKGNFIGTATIKGMRIMKLNRVNEFISFLDAGYEPGAFVNMVKRMYKNKVPDVMMADFYYILLKWDGEQKLDFDGRKEASKIDKPETSNEERRVSHQ
ncbi:MAG: hypothetical protein RSO15_14825 [Bacteroides sp.]|uniref:hypothetical protein n=2 Tax=Bacteroides sp. TaxID=29523 RepID=UPI002FC5BD88